MTHFNSDVIKKPAILYWSFVMIIIMQTKKKKNLKEQVTHFSSDVKKKPAILCWSFVMIIIICYQLIIVIFIIIIK